MYDTLFSEAMALIIAVCAFGLILVLFASILFILWVVTR